VETLIADAAKARKELGWEPKITFRDLVRIMVDADMAAAGLTPVGEGTKILLKKGLGNPDDAFSNHASKEKG